MPDAPQWARVKGDHNYRLRRGAWYQVVRLTPDAAILEVGQRAMSVPRELLQIEVVRPRIWSVVPRPYDAIDLPLSWGSSYGVCPACHQQWSETQCLRCQAWSAHADWYAPDGEQPA